MKHVVVLLWFDMNTFVESSIRTKSFYNFEQFKYLKFTSTNSETSKDGDIRYTWAQFWMSFYLWFLWVMYK